MFADFTDRKTAAQTQLHVRHGEPLVFGENGSKGIRFNSETFALDIIDTDQSPDDVLVHDESNGVIARLLVDLQMPVALGVIYRQPAQCFEDAFYAHHPSRMRRTKSVQNVIAGPNTWTVK